MKEPADIFTLAGARQEDQARGASKATARPRSATSISAIEARREISLERFIYALGIRHVGETTAIALARGYGTWKAFHDACVKVAEEDEETRAEMDALDQIGETVIEAIADYFGEWHNREMVERLVKQMTTIVDAEKPKTDTAVAGKTVVFTGTLEKMTRDEAKALAERLGAEVVGLRVEEDRLRRGGPGCGIEAKRSAEARRHGAERRRLGEADRAVSAERKLALRRLH